MPVLKRMEVSMSYVQCFLYLVSFSVNVSIFHIIWLPGYCDLAVLILRVNAVLEIQDGGGVSRSYTNILPGLI